jgi:putative transposase
LVSALVQFSMSADNPYVYLDATYLHGRDPARKQVISRAVIVAVGITASGQRELLGIEVGDSEDEAFWTAFLRRLKERGLTGVRLAISDAHAGLKKAIARCFQGCSWQRCRVHFARNLLVKVPKASQDMVAAALRSVFVQQEATAVAVQWDQVITMLTEKFPAAAALMAQAKDDVLAFRSSPAEHWRKIWSTNPLERLNVAPRGALSGAAHQTPHPRRRDLAQRRRHHPPGGGPAAGAAGGVAVGGAPRLF